MNDVNCNLLNKKLSFFHCEFKLNHRSMLFPFFLTKTPIIISPILSVIISCGNLPVSIIIPIFNKENYLNRSMPTVIHQTLKHIEIICIDDCSTDNSTSFILNLMKSDSRIKLIRNLYNQGTSLTRLNGVSNARGEYIMSLDPDDLLYLYAAEKNYKNAKSSNADVLEYRMKYRSQKIYDRNWFPCKTNYTNRGDILKKFSQFKMNWNVCKRLIKRSIYSKAAEFLLPFLEGKKINVGDDLIQCGMVYFLTNRLICTHVLSYIYFINADNSESGKYQELNLNSVQVNYGKALIRYLYSQNDITKCSFQDFMMNQTVSNLYHQLRSIEKVPKIECKINLPNFTCTQNLQFGTCLIKRTSN
ncbi:hypothetical protein TRFO_35505 [Tritrichomonas foetus]|uniref:Glycosyltransferase 2-like domain-containing protein n=1 Tax=Tritrichomonas foetus TaxID=1144522 RepID=A0A1J4JFY9_9EUKA|nr:hypothetical protein TRFO_35505 [Tritrichomonas foetus]|eukprot:OHS98134.1 hypothetical protein TRFO_35505 [Tritrichomonas foetus]